MSFTHTPTRFTVHDEMHWKSCGASMYTYAAGNTAHPSPAPNVRQLPLTSTPILGGCKFTAKFRTQRRKITFTLLHLLLRKSDGGRWSILGMDLCNKPVTD
jgi:hypothetical protein